MDLRNENYEVRIAKGDEPKTMCVPRYGVYDWLVMPYGLTNAPTTFYTLMNNCFYRCMDQFMVVYLDDIVINNNTFEKHMELFKRV